jgi:hypothetical protein
MLAAHVGVARGRRLMNGGSSGNKRHEGIGCHRRGGDSSLGGETPEGWNPKRWLRDETSPQGIGRSKPTRGCETSRSERVGLVNRTYVDS